ncbi:MAG: hypothetical protein IJI14_16035 [Anaerolineaceae bacterium]|nr:hypothetical protein [Anaerolineaceae bacterium]
MKKNGLSLLKNFAWLCEDLLYEAVGRNEAQKLLMSVGERITEITRTDGRKYYSPYSGAEGMIPGIPRREMVRKFAISKFGYDVLETGKSPYMNADLIFYDKKSSRWVRIWGDMGYLSPESLVLFRNPPIFGKNILDLIVTAQGGERPAVLCAQTELGWADAGKNQVEIYFYKSSNPVIPETNGDGADFPYTPDMECYPRIDFSKSNTPKMYNDTKKKEINIQLIRAGIIGGIGSMLSVLDYDILRFIACNPFYQSKEIALLYGGDDSDENDLTGLKRERDMMYTIDSRIKDFIELGLVQNLFEKKYQDRLILTWTAIDLLAGYHGTIPLYMQKYCQWPQHRFEKEDFDQIRDTLTNDYPYFDSHNYYSKQWGVNLHAHQKLCREFCNALVTGSRTLKSRYKINVTAKDVNTISANLKTVRFINGKMRIRPVHPDGRCTLSYVKDNTSQKKWQIFIEIERNTNTIKTLMEKIDNYRKVIPAARQFYNDFDDVVLVFFFDDSDNRHGSVENKINLLLKKMKECGITGYISTTSRAAAGIPLQWKPKYGYLEEKMCGSMMLYRKIWYSTNTDTSAGDEPFLGISLD